MIISSILIAMLYIVIGSFFVRAFDGRNEYPMIDWSKPLSADDWMGFACLVTFWPMFFGTKILIETLSWILRPLMLFGIKLYDKIIKYLY